MGLLGFGRTGALKMALAGTLFTAIVLAMVGLEGSAAQAQQSYTVTDLGTLGDSGPLVGSAATGINGSGQVVGQSYLSSGPLHAFLYESGQMKDLGNAFGGTDSVAYDINNSGQVVGYATIGAGGQSHAFLYENGQMKDLGVLPERTFSIAKAINGSGQVAGTSGTRVGFNRAFLYENGQLKDLGTLPGASDSQAAGINGSGQVVGTSTYSDGHDRGFLYENGQLKDLGTLPGGSLHVLPRAINGSGQVVGYATNSDGINRAFLYENGLMKDLGTLPGDSSSDALGINGSGQVVGTSFSSGTAHAFLYQNGQMVDLNDSIPSDSGWDLHHATDINDAGQIVGNGARNGEFHAYLLTPSGDVDVTPPTLSIPADITQVATGPDGAVVDFTATANDDVDGSVPARCTPASGGTFPLGTTTVGCEATDAAGNTARASFEVTVQYAFAGFYQPVDNNGVYNTVKAGSAIPVKFSLGRDMGLDIFYSGYPKSSATPCDAQAQTDAIEQTASTADAGKLTYDASSDRYNYVWKTDKSWAGTCRKLDLGLKDGSQHQAYFKLTK
jgi:probable HAF family extracellular repeat protein